MERLLAASSVSAYGPERVDSMPFAQKLLRLLGAAGIALLALGLARTCSAGSARPLIRPTERLESSAPLSAPSGTSIVDSPSLETGEGTRSTALAATADPEQEQAPPRLTVRGIVVDSQGNGVPEATVELCTRSALLPARDFRPTGVEPRVARTDPEGRFRFVLDGPASSASLVAWSAGYARAGVHGLTAPGDYTLVLAEGGATIRGVVQEEESLDALSEASVWCSSVTSLGARPRETRTGHRGEYVFDGLRAGVYQIHTATAAHEQVSRLVLSQSGEETVVDFVLGRQETFSGTVVAQDTGLPVPGALVTDLTRRARTDDSGRFTFVKPSDSTQRVLMEISKQGFVTRTYAADAGTEAVTIELERAIELAVRLRGPAELARGAVVEMRQDSAGGRVVGTARIVALPRAGERLAIAGGFSPSAPAWALLHSPTSLRVEAAPWSNTETPFAGGTRSWPVWPLTVAPGDAPLRIQFDR